MAPYKRMIMRTSQEVVPCFYEGVEPGDYVIYTTNGMGGAHTGAGIYRGMLNNKAAIDVQTWKETYVHRATGDEFVDPPYPHARGSETKDWNEWHLLRFEKLKEYIPAKLPWDRRTYLQNNRMTKLDDVINTKRM